MEIKAWLDRSALQKNFRRHFDLYSQCYIMAFIVFQSKRTKQVFVEKVTVLAFADLMKIKKVKKKPQSNSNQLFDKIPMKSLIFLFLFYNFSLRKLNIKLVLWPWQFSLQGFSMNTEKAEGCAIHVTSMGFFFSLAIFHFHFTRLRLKQNKWIHQQNK